MLKKILLRAKQNQFLLEELIKRDFKRKYKRTVLGMAWSVLYPLLLLLVMTVVFTNFFGRRVEHYTVYLFCGTLVFSYFRESTNGGMHALMENASIFTRVNVPKYLFLLSKNASSLINFCLTLCVFFLFVILNGITPRLAFLALAYPIACLVIFNVGAGLILSALFVFFRDTSYLYDIFTTLLMYMSVIFYTLDGFSPRVRWLFLLNPVYCYIRYFRSVVLENTLPSPGFHLLCAFYAVAALAVGGRVYQKYNHEFLYYV